MPKLNQTINELISRINAFIPEGKITYTLCSENTGELMDSCNEYSQQLIKPFSDSAKQDYYYFNIKIKENLTIQIKSNPKN